MSTDPVRSAAMRVAASAMNLNARRSVAGLPPLFEHPSGGRVYGAGGVPAFAVLGPFNGEPATVGNGSMFAFQCERREEVNALHAKALELGGACEGAPGLRGPGWWFAYFRDLDGNKLCAFCPGA